MMACADCGPNHSSVLEGRASLGVSRSAWRPLLSRPSLLSQCPTRWLVRRELLCRLRELASRQALSQRRRYICMRATMTQAFQEFLVARAVTSAARHESALNQGSQASGLTSSRDRAPRTILFVTAISPFNKIRSSQPSISGSDTPAMRAFDRGCMKTRLHVWRLRLPFCAFCNGAHRQTNVIKRRWPLSAV